MSLSRSSPIRCRCKSRTHRYIDGRSGSPISGAHELPHAKDSTAIFSAQRASASGWYGIPFLRRRTDESNEYWAQFGPQRRGLPVHPALAVEPAVNPTGQSFCPRYKRSMTGRGRPAARVHRRWRLGQINSRISFAKLFAEVRRFADVVMLLGERDLGG